MGEAMISDDHDRVEVVAEKEKIEEQTKEEVGEELEGERSLIDDEIDNDQEVDIVVESQIMLKEESKFDINEDQNVLVQKVEDF